MTHFMTIVLVEPDVSEPARRAEALMEPFFSADWDETARCDGFVVGGRFDGDIWGKPQHYLLRPKEFQARYGLDVVTDEDNIRPVAVLREGLLPYAVVIPDGEWHDREGKTEAEWIDEWASLRCKYQGYLAVAIDCHC